MDTYMTVKGQIVIPSKIRRKFGIKEGTRVDKVAIAMTTAAAPTQMLAQYDTTAQMRERSYAFGAHQRTALAGTGERRLLLVVGTELGVVLLVVEQRIAEPDHRLLGCARSCDAAQNPE